MFFGPFVHDSERENFASAVLMKINTAKYHETLRIFIVHRDHTMLPSSNWDLSKHCQFFPLKQIEIEHADIIKRSTTCVLKDFIISTAIYNQ